MKVIVFGATGMVGQGVLRECLLDAEVEQVLVVGRTPTGQQHPKLREVVHRDFADFSAIESEFAGYDACFFCLGVSSVGMSPEEYERITYDYTLAAARPLARLNPELTFVYVSGRGHGQLRAGEPQVGTGQGANRERVAGPAFPGVRVPPRLHPADARCTSKTRLYSALYRVVVPLYPLVKRLVPGSVTTTEQVGRAMIAVAKSGAPVRILGTREINAL